MTFIPSIQALIGPHAAQSSGQQQCAVDWTNNSAFINGGGIGPYLCSVGLLTGNEQAFALCSSFGGGALFVDNFPVGLDDQGRIYINGFHVGLIQIEPLTLTELANAAGVPNFDWVQGTISCVPFSGKSYMLSSAQGTTNTFNYYAVSDEVTYSFGYSSSNYLNYSAATCAGALGSGLGYLVSGPLLTGETQFLRLFSVDCNAKTTGLVGTILPAAVDAAWTEIYQQGICLDQTDGHLLMAVQGQSGASQEWYIVKVDEATAAVIWVSPVPGRGGGPQMAFSRIANQRYCHIANGTGGNGVFTTIDTSDGSSTSFTLNGLLVYGPQCYSDALGAIVCNLAYTAGGTAPIQRNSTPASYLGWSLIYVAPGPSPPPGAGRRFIAEIGPIRVLN